MSRGTRYTYQYRLRCDVTRLNLPGHVIAVGTPAIRHIHVKSYTEIIQFQKKICNSRANHCEGEYFFVVANDLYRQKKTAPPTAPYLRGLDNDMIRRTTSFLYRKWRFRCLKCNRCNILHSCIHLHLHLLTIII